METHMILEGLPDTQNESDHREIIIDRVGVKELRYPIRYRDATGNEHPTVAKFEMTVELPANLKGTHMSRFVEALHAFDQPLDTDSIRVLTRTVGREVAVKLCQRRLRIHGLSRERGSGFRNEEPS